MAKKCSKCGKLTKDKYKHCPYCGGKLSELTKSEKRERRQKIISHKAIWISLFTLLALAILFNVGNFIMVPHTVTVSYNASVPYLIEENITKCYELIQKQRIEVRYISLFEGLGICDTLTPLCLGH